MPLFTINTCKTFGCRNLGLATSPDYVWPDYRLGYPALHCKACGSYPPLFNSVEYQRWANTYLSSHAREFGHFCPICFRAAPICYGHNPGGTQRFQCRNCKIVWTPKRQSQSMVLLPPESICSEPLIVPFQGALADQALYCLLSFDALRGNILHVSSNFTPFPVGHSLRYRWRGSPPSPIKNDDIVQRITMKERQFLQRHQFDEIQYGAASLKRNARGELIRPVIAAHGHFRALRAKFPTITTHIIAHECFLRGAVITAWSERFRQRQASLWFVEEEIKNDGSAAPWELVGKTYQGWWQNQWQHWKQDNNRKMVCALTDTLHNSGAEMNLSASRHFKHWLQQQPLFQNSPRLSAARVSNNLQILAAEFNALLSSAT